LTDKSQFVPYLVVQVKNKPQLIFNSVLIKKQKRFNIKMCEIFFVKILLKKLFVNFLNFCIPYIEELGVIDIIQQ